MALLPATAPCTFNFKTQTEGGQACEHAAILPGGSWAPYVKPQACRSTPSIVQRYQQQQQQQDYEAANLEAGEAAAFAREAVLVARRAAAKVSIQLPSSANGPLPCPFVSGPPLDGFSSNRLRGWGEVFAQCLTTGIQTDHIELYA